jgi:AAA family ATP:ADP antiporter
VSGAAGATAGSQERKALLAAAAASFCLLGGYYMLRPIRDAMALDAGVSNFVLFSVVLGCSTLLLPVYWWLVGRTPRGRLLWFVYGPFALVFLALAVALDMYPRDQKLAFAYFVAHASANLYIISVFWSAMADVWRPELAKRFYGYVAAGGSAGAVLSPIIVTSFVRDVGHAPLICVACASILASAALVSSARATLRRCAGGAGVPDSAIPVGGRALDDLARLVRTPYLLGIAGIIIAGQVIGAFMYSEQGRMIAGMFASDLERTAFFARLELYVNLLALFFQAVVVTWLTRRGSVALSLAAMPVLIGATFVVLVAAPVAVVFFATQVIRRAADYGLGKPPREMLFTVLNPETKFKSKSLIDTVMQRSSDVLGQWLYQFVAGLGLAGIAALCGALCAVLLAAARLLGSGFEKRRREVEPAGASAS